MSLIVRNASVDLGARRVVDDVSITLEAGEIVALLGPNGAGKTSLMRACLGLLPLTGGDVSLQGVDPRRLSARLRALRAAYLPQRPQAVWPVSVASLVALGRFAHGAAPDRLSPRDQAAVDAALEACGLSDLRDRRMDHISGGEKARAHLARALAQQAPILVLDEPSAGLDPAQALGMAHILRARAASGGAVLFSTHDVALAAGIADRVVLMRSGRVMAAGAAEQALTPDALAAAYGRSGRLTRVDGGYAAVFTA
ncbi:MAG: ABC transporter ATP-binding protein [Hyphomonadaceae bacterium]|nr:ABC transporter ATP-binding protein [Hyphomonadaceae bacterium]MBX3509599.1 ABC transporter ATP-binding protein [Hyphomonadaceae bacterium]